MRQFCGIFLLLIVGWVFGIMAGVGLYEMRSQPAIDYTLEKNADIMEEVIRLNTRIQTTQDLLWRIGHYTNINHGDPSPICPECMGTPDITTLDGIRRANELGTETRPDTLETVKENSDEIHDMISSSRGMIGGLKITADIILDNLRKTHVEAK